MGLFGGSSSGSGDTDSFASKLRTPSGGELDLSFDTGASSIGSGDPLGGGLGMGGDGDFQAKVQMETQKAQLMTQIHAVNDVCWETCIGSVGSSLSSRDQTCLSNCTNRFIETTLFITNRFGQLAQKMQGH